MIRSPQAAENAHVDASQKNAQCGESNGVKLVRVAQATWASPCHSVPDRTKQTHSCQGKGPCLATIGTAMAVLLPSNECSPVQIGVRNGYHAATARMPQRSVQWPVTASMQPLTAQQEHATSSVREACALSLLAIAVGTMSMCHHHDAASWCSLPADNPQQHPRHCRWVGRLLPTPLHPRLKTRHTKLSLGMQG